MTKTEKIGKSEVLFNTTKYLLDSYTKGVKLTQEEIGMIDFSEVSKKIVRFNGSYGKADTVIKQTLAMNVISFLPFEAYEDCVSLGWIDAEAPRGLDELSIMNYSIALKRFDFLEKILNLGEVFLDNKKPKNMDEFWVIDNYSNKVLKSILNINTYAQVITDNSANCLDEKKMTERFLKVFKRAIKQENKVRQSRNDVLGAKIMGKIEEKDWLKGVFLDGSDKKIDFIQKVLRCEALFPILDSLPRDSDIFSEESLLEAFSYGNVSACLFIAETLGNNFNKSKIESSLSAVLDEFSKREILQYGGKDGSAIKEGDNLRLKNVLFLANKMLGSRVDLNISDYSGLLLKSGDLKEGILSFFKVSSKSKLVSFLTADDMDLLGRNLSHLADKASISLNNKALDSGRASVSDIACLKMILSVRSFMPDRFFSKTPRKEFESNIKMEKVLTFTKKTLIPLLAMANNVPKENCDVLFRSFKLTFLIEKDGEHLAQNKLKIKI